jgi:uncharacterized protein YjbI with pentapeptide repeats
MTIDPKFTSSSQPSLPTAETTDLLQREGMYANPGVAGRSEGRLTARSPVALILLVAIGILLLGLGFNNFWLTLAGTLVTLVLSLKLVFPALQEALTALLFGPQQAVFMGSLGLFGALIGLLKLLRVDRLLVHWYKVIDWNTAGSIGEIGGALGQILIAVLAVYIAWRQYVISKDLTIQQNIITQQQTIDTYFQGISDLVLDEQGLLEDWPQERAIAEGRTAAILSSVNAAGKAKILRFLSRARLLSPLKRDQRLGRAILDGTGGYAEDRRHGIRVINLGVMLARTDLSNTDLRWTDLSDINLMLANLSYCDLARTNLAGTILCGASLRAADLTGVKFYYGKAETASPRDRTLSPDYKTGAYTGAVIENIDFTHAEDMSEEQRYYCCAWGGSQTRSTIPSGCEGIPNKLGR